MLTCKEASRWLSQSLDQSLPRLARLELRIHLWLCRSCSNFSKQLKFLRQAAQRLEKEPFRSDPPYLGEAARERIRKALHR